MDDYPNDSNSAGLWTPEEDKEQAKIVRKEDKLIAASLPLIDDILEWFDSEAQAALSLDLIVVNDMMTDDQIARQLMVQKEVAAKLRHKREEIVSIMDSWKERQKEKRNG